MAFSEGERNDFIQESLSQGMSLSELQDQLAQRFGIHMTYMELRMLTSELQVNWEKQDEKAVRSKGLPETKADATPTRSLPPEEERPDAGRGWRSLRRAEPRFRARSPSAQEQAASGISTNTDESGSRPTKAPPTPTSRTHRNSSPPCRPKCKRWDTDCQGQGGGQGCPPENGVLPASSASRRQCLPRQNRSVFVSCSGTSSYIVRCAVRTPSRKYQQQILPNTCFHILKNG